jgi:hypothetical protein
VLLVAVHLRKFQFASECLSQVVQAVLGIKRTPYSTILALDRKVRDHQALKVPPNGATGPSELGAATVTLTLQRFMLKAMVEMSQYFASFHCDRLIYVYVMCCIFFAAPSV